jgi:hypothetical protein
MNSDAGELLRRKHTGIWMLVTILVLNWRRENQGNLQRDCRRILTICSNIWPAVRQTKELISVILFIFCIVIFWNFSITNKWTFLHSKYFLHYLAPTCCRWAGYRYNDWLRAGRSGDRIPVWARFSTPVQTGPGFHPDSCTMGTGSFLWIKSGQGVTLTPHPLLVPLVMKE